ncbi:MAG: sensor histidine kinase, partial [Clostridium sp.]
MGTLLDRDERVKIGFFIIMLLTIQGLIFYGINTKMISNLNNKYIQQNTAIVGEIYSLDKEIGESIIPIVTGKSSGNYEAGSSVMSKYSYTEDLSSKSNPLFENNIDNSNLYILVIVIATILIALIG